MKQRPANQLRWRYLAIGTFALLFAGVIYAWSILKAPLMKEFGWPASSLSLNFTLTMCSFCIGGILGGFLLNRFHFLPVCIISALLSALGFVIVGSAMRTLTMLYFGYGILGGLGIGIAYNAIISTVTGWFPDRKGLCSGVLMMGFGSSALVIGTLADRMIENDLLGWRFSYCALGVALGWTLLVCAFTLRPSVPDTKKAAGFEEDGITSREMLKTGTFWKAFLCVVFLAAPGNTVISIAKDLCLDVGLTAGVATTLAGILSVCNGFGRILTGIVFDRFGRRFTMIGANLLAFFATLLTLLALTQKSPFLCVCGLCLTGLSYGTCPTISSAFILENFGASHFSSNFPIMNCNLIFASMIVTGTSLLTSKTGSYISSFAVLLALILVAFVLNVSLALGKEKFHRT